MNSTYIDYEPVILLNDDFHERISEGELRHVLEYLPDIYKDMVKELTEDKE